MIIRPFTKYLVAKINDHFPMKVLIQHLLKLRLAFFMEMSENIIKEVLSKFRENFMIHSKRNFWYRIAFSS